MGQPSILVVDDEFAVQQALKAWFSKSGYETHTADSGEAALSKLEEVPFDVVFLDIMMPGLNGIETLEEIKKRYPSTIVVMMTAYASIESAVEAMKLGAGDYLVKPLDPDLLDPLVARLLKYRELLQENVLLRDQISRMIRFENLVGKSDAMQAVYTMIRDVAGSDASVLITGETGTGKELVAKAIHAVSPRCEAPFIPINCGASRSISWRASSLAMKKEPSRGRPSLGRGAWSSVREARFSWMKLEKSLPACRWIY